MDIKEFINPPAEYRSAPFWSWNDDLDPEELKRQLFLMKKGGMAGGFMHSREGLITPYFSRQWMKCITETVKFAKKIKTLVYLYDEDRWPSGFAGGAIKSKYYMKALKINKKTKKFQAITMPCIAWFNNTGYLDTMNGDAVKNFIDETHEAYKKLLAREFNRTVPAIFTDEPNYFQMHYFDNTGAQNVDKEHYEYMPWSECFDKIFMERYNYDILLHIPSLIENKGDYRKIRYDYYKLANELFLNNFGKQIFDWCGKNNIQFTGHYLQEDTFSLQMRTDGNVMPFYEYMHIPGVDHLGRQIKDVFLTMKQCSSVCHQTGKKRMLTETFGGSGQNLSFLYRKWIANWDSVLGANFFCPHLWDYSIAGERKRDWPQALSYQQPWYKYNRLVDDYIARISYITSQGEFRADVALLSPIESVWCNFTPLDTKETDRLNKNILDIMRSLCGNHNDFDLCDESIMEKYAEVRDNKLAVGKMEYRVFVIPPVSTLRESTIDILWDFVKSGGTVIGFAPAPEMVNAVKDKRIEDFYKNITVVSGTETLTAAVDKACKKQISIKDRNSKELRDIYYQHRKINGENMYFLVNISDTEDYAANIEIPSKPGESLQHYNAENGAVTQLKSVSAGNRLSCELYFPRAGSHIIMRTPKNKLKENFIPLPSGKIKIARNLPDAGWACSRNNLNALVIDYCRISVNRKNYSKEQYFMDTQKWARRNIKDGSLIKIEYSFNTSLTRKPERILLVVERAKLYNIRVNGMDVPSTAKSWWIDINFNKIDITDYVKLKGENTVELSAKYKNATKPGTLVYAREGTEIEAIYILGDFSVKGKYRRIKGGISAKGFVISDSVMPAISDVVSGGNPFYAGSITFEKVFDWNGKKNRKIYLTIGKPHATVIRVSLNGRETGTLSWAPYALDITNDLRQGKNRIELEITNSLRNLLGNHHTTEVDLSFSPPWTFNDKKKWTDEYTFVEFGLGEIELCEEK